MCHVRVLSTKNKVTSEKPLRMGFVDRILQCSIRKFCASVRKIGGGYSMGMVECVHGLVYRKIAGIESISVRKRVYWLQFSHALV